jgi:hypothetical protein
MDTDGRAIFEGAELFQTFCFFE